MSGRFLLGIDIGTSSCKIAVFDREGNVQAECSEKYNVYFLQDGWAEQNPDEWWAAVCKGLKTLFEEKGIHPEEIIGIGIAGQSWSAIPVDRNGHPLAKNPIWLDVRAASICETLSKKIGTERIFALCGNPLKPQYTTGKICWFKQNLFEVYRSAAKFLQSNSFIGFKLTGAMSQDLSQCYGLHCFDIRKGCWDVSMCKDFGIDPELLPEIVLCHQIIGQVTTEASIQTGLLTGTPVVAGGLDAACGTLGAGVIHEGQTQEQGGQAGGMSICLSEVHADSRLILSNHVVPDRWLLQGGTTGGGGAINWFAHEFGYMDQTLNKKDEQKIFERLSELAAKAEPGSNGVIFLPYMAGERSPIWDEKACGVLYGLSYKAKQGDLVRAVMEGAAYSINHNLRIAADAGAVVGKLRAMGGAANSLIWTQIKSDVTGCEIEVPASDSATALGAAILAGVGTGFYESFESAVDSTVKIKRSHYPDQRNHRKYSKEYQKYLRLYEDLKAFMHEEKAEE